MCVCVKERESVCVCKKRGHRERRKREIGRRSGKERGGKGNKRKSELGSHGTETDRQIEKQTDRMTVKHRKAE